MAIRLRLDKPWQPLTAEAATRLPGQLGVYQVADAKGAILYIGQAGARSPFGLRSELQRELKPSAARAASSASRSTSSTARAGSSC